MRNLGSRQNLEGWRRRKAAPAPAVPKPNSSAAASASTPAGTAEAAMTLSPPTNSSGPSAAEPTASLLHVHGIPVARMTPGRTFKCCTTP
jgi:hypothetical protein